MKAVMQAVMAMVVAHMNKITHVLAAGAGYAAADYQNLMDMAQSAVSTSV